jgi:hypothetical protein
MAVCSMCSQSTTLYKRAKDGTITCMSCASSVPKTDIKTKEWLKQKLIVSSDQLMGQKNIPATVPIISDVDCAACLTAVRGDPPGCEDCRWIRRFT